MLPQREGFQEVETAALRCCVVDPLATMALELGAVPSGLWLCTGSNIRTIQVGPPLRSQKAG
eukprot:2142766-Pyramimonas_sp.AAC.1